MSAPVQDGLIAEWQARDATPTEALNAWTERAARLEAENARLRRELDEPQPVTLDDAYAAIRGIVEENKRLRAEVKELRAGPAGALAEAIDMLRAEARDSEGVIDTVRRLIEGQSDQLRDSIERAAATLGLHSSANGEPASIIAQCRHVLGAGSGETLLEACTRVAQRQPQPAPLTPERAAILDEAAEATVRMVAAIQGQAREGEAPDQTVERLIRERDESRTRLAFCDHTLGDVCRVLGLNVDEVSRGDVLRAIERLTSARAEAERLRGEGDDIEAELLEVFGEHRADDSTIAKVRTLITWHHEEVDFIGQIESLLGLDGDPGEIPDAIRKLIEERDHLRATIQAAIPAIRAGINALGSSEADVRSRNAARDSLHALEAAVEGAEPPAAVLSAAPICDSCGTDDHPEHGCAGSAYGKPECLASEGKEG